MKTRKDYTKPFLAMEQFQPQEVVAACNWTVETPVTNNIRNYSRIDFNGNGIFEHVDTWSTPEYTERGYNYFGNDAAGTTIKPTNEIVNVNVYKYVGTQITPSDENGAHYDNGNYRLVATQLLKHTYGTTVKYYPLEIEGVTYTWKNVS